MKYVGSWSAKIAEEKEMYQEYSVVKIGRKWFLSHPVQANHGVGPFKTKREKSHDNR